MLAQYTALYLTISSTIGFAPLKRPRSDTSYTSNTYCKFNSRGCNNIACKYPHKCLKCGKDYAVLSKACAQKQQGEPYKVGSSLTIILTLIIRLGPRPNTLLLFPTFIKVKALYHSLLPLRILVQHSLLSNYLGNLLAILVSILTYSYKIRAESIPTIRSYRNYNSSQDNANLISKKIVLDLIKGYIRIAIEPIIVLPLSLVPKSDRGYRRIYNLSFLLASLVNNVILKEYRALVYTTVTAI